MSRISPRVMDMRQAWAFSLVLLLCAVLTPTAAQQKEKTGTPCPMVKIEVERLADLNTPRTGHATLCVGGEMVVAGGHTKGFVPTATAEYYADGQWHTLPLAVGADSPAHRCCNRCCRVLPPSSKRPS